MPARQLVYYVASTLDGFIARRDGSLDCFLCQGEHFADLFNEYPETFPAHPRGLLGVTGSPRRFDTVIMGRSTYEVGVREGVTSPYSSLRQFVVSSTMTESPDASVQLCREDPLQLVRALKAESGKDLWLCGGAKLAAAIQPEIDEMILKINPVVIGEGIPLFAGASFTRRTVLVEHRVYGNGFVLARYLLEARP